MKAFITGINGQDGSYLSEHLLSLGYEVYGIVRRNSVSEHQESRIAHLSDQIQTFYGDVTDAGSIEKVMAEVMPDEIYNLAAMSHVRISSDIPQFTAQVNSIGVLNVLEAYRRICPEAKFYQASSSEMFGSSFDEDGYQRETTKMNPVSPYGCSKVFGYNIVRHYRNAYKLHACNGILFNHESPLRRGSNFVTTKIVDGAIKIKLGLCDTLELGNLESYRDWGFSGDYVRAMHMIVNHSEPDDFVVATGETHSVREWCQLAFSKLGLNYLDHVVQNDKYLRPEELKYLKGDSTKIRTVLGWKPEYSFDWLITEMVNQRFELLKYKRAA
jgi:GDPmannose 4,6-dehydratase